MRRIPLVVALFVVAGAIAGPGWSPAGAAHVAARPRGDIVVSAAASLTGAFSELGERFERQNPKAGVTFNFGSSSALVNQIRGGAPADVLATADLASMRPLVDGGEIADTPTPFARNRMQIAVKPGNPENVRSVADLAKVGTLSLCATTVPCGAYATRVLARANVAVPESRITRGVDAKAAVGAVSQGDADAAIVYATDVRAGGRAITGVEIPDAQNVVAVYPIAPIATSGNRRLAEAFVAYVLAPAGQRTLGRYGFRAP